ncbi:MAG: class I SAM-dependent methyltransferase [Saprospiraceae bacterium]|nr:class I SAM-dependent methyltransferase [Saprospiraceae bacterium]
MSNRFSHWQFYLNKAQEVIGEREGLNVLKTDAYNELLDIPIEGGIAPNLGNQNITLLEYEVLYVNKVRKLIPEIEVVEGDIRKLPFENNTFDVLMDFSTIDHIQPKDLEQTLRGYKNVVKRKGDVIIVSWVTTNSTVYEETLERGKTWHTLCQFFFDYKSLSKMMRNIFDDVKEEPVPETGQENDTWLVCYTAKA